MRHHEAYLVVTATVFALPTVAPIWRIAVEGLRMLSDPAFALTTVFATALFLWAARLLRSILAS